MKYREYGYSERARREQISIVNANINKMPEKYHQVVRSLFTQKAMYTPNQANYIDALYEKMMKYAGYGGIETKHDFGKRKNDQ